MSTFQLRASLALWRKRLIYRTRRWEYWRKVSASTVGKTSLVNKWETLRREALGKVHLREGQIAKMGHTYVTMYDSTNASSIPAGAAAFAGYVNGRWPSFAAMRARFRRARFVSITVNASGRAEALDVETGDATPAEAPGWVKREIPRLRRRGHRPKVYANASTMPAVQAALKAAGIGRSEYCLWVADYDGVARVPAGFDAKQYENRESQNVDVSICAIDFFR